MPTPICAALRAACAWCLVTGLHAAEPVGHNLPQPAQRRVDFAADIKPLLEQSCLPCHGPNKPKSGHRIDARHAIIKGGDSDEVAIVPGQSQSSPLVHYIAGLVPDMEMPPLDSRDKYPALSAEQVGLVRAWIDQGVSWPETVTLVRRDAAAADTRTTTGAEHTPVNPIFTYIRQADLASLERSLSDPAVLESRDAAGNTPLMQAALYLGARQLELLLKRGGDPNATSRARATALMKATSDVEKVKLLLAAGAKVNARSAAGNNALIIASHRHGSAAVVKELLAHGADVKAANPIGINALAAAAETGDHEVLGLLLAAGADVNTAIRPPYSPATESTLMIAVNYGHLECVKLLLKHGADPQFTSEYGNALHFAALKDRVEIARLLIDRGLDLNLPGRRIGSFRNDQGLTPLMYAAMTEQNDPTLVQLLIDRGAKVNAKTPKGDTALAIALKRGETKVVAALRAAGATADVSKTSAVDLGRHWSRGQIEKDVAAAAKAAAKSGLAVLQRSGVRFDDATAGRCVSCHQHSQPALATRLANVRKFEYDGAIASTMAASMYKNAARRVDHALEEPPPVPSITAWTMIGLHAAGQTANEVTDGYAYSLARSQYVDGRWITRAARAPTDYSDVTTTALAIRALKLYTPPTMVSEFARRIDSAASWLRRVRPEATEERVYQILGLHWADADRSQIGELAERLREQQRADGGWAQLPTLKSDAYAAGLVLYTLNQAGVVSSTHPSYQKGIRFLLTEQLHDGSWFVETRASPVQVAVDDIFSHGTDQWISTTATTWSTMALMLGTGEENQRKAAVSLR